MIFEIEPHIGIGAVKLGMSPKEVKNTIGSSFYCHSTETMDYYFENTLQIEYSAGLVTFIGISFSNEYTVLFLGKNVFDIEASLLFELFSRNEKGSHSYSSSEYLFPEQILTLWDADEQYDKIGGEQRVIWAQVGLGSKSYLEAVNKNA